MDSAVTPEISFWNWFQTQDTELFQFERNQKAVFRRLSAAMKKVHEDLTFEFGPVKKNGTREFVISAGGNKKAFSAVESLHNAAPPLKNWVFIKFRPRRFPIHDVEFKGYNVRVEDVLFAMFKDEDPNKTGLMLFLPGYSEDEGLKGLSQIGYLFLDEALGEYAVEMKIGAIVIAGLDSKYIAHAHPLSELPDHFDRRFEVSEA